MAGERKASFLLRVWKSREENGWLGEVEHIQSGSRKKISSLDQVVQVLESLITEEIDTVSGVKTRVK